MTIVIFSSEACSSFTVLHHPPFLPSSPTIQPVVSSPIRTSHQLTFPDRPLSPLLFLSFYFFLSSESARVHTLFPIVLFFSPHPNSFDVTHSYGPIRLLLSLFSA